MKQPPVIIPENIVVPQTENAVLSNGVKLYVLDCSKQEVLRVSFVFGAGTSRQNVPFSASTTLNTLCEGSKKYTAKQIAEKLDFYGSYFDVSIDRDSCVVTVCCLKKFYEPIFEIAEQILIHPTFPEKDIRTYCSKRKEQLNVSRSKPDFVSRELFTKALYGENHPYGNSYPSECYDTLTREDIEDFYRAHYTAANCFVVVSGDVDSQHVEAISRIAEQLPLGDKIVERTFPKPMSTPLVKMEMKDCVQASLRIGKIAFSRTHPDFIGMQVVITILGGYFGSRLMKNLREKRGYTYGIYSAMVNFDLSGYFAIVAEVGKSVSDKALAEVFKELEKLRTKKVSEKELKIVKNIIVGEVLRILDGPFGIADITIENIQNNTDNNYTNEFLDKVKMFTPDDILELAQKHLNPENFVVTIVD